VYRPVEGESIHYRDTRGLDPSRPTFCEVIIRGIADGGGLYVPQSLPRFTLDEIIALAGLPYAERARTVFGRFGLDLPDECLAGLLTQAYGENFDDPATAPVREVGDGRFILELWHGPTLAFKDMALQVLPLLFAEAVRTQSASGRHGPEEHLILVATSGDTGTAALAGFADTPGVRIAVFYPSAGVSDTQRLQMVTRGGANVAVWGIDGNFDDCQDAVKATFTDPGFTARLRREHNVLLSSANSINWGRLLPQIVYYLSAYADLAAAGGIAAGAALDVCVPTGNFGNILAAWYARRLGVPIERLLCASNENNVLTDLLVTGTYDISDRPLIPTPSPAMDILISSNVERLLFELTGDPEQVRAWADSLRAEGRFTLDRDTFAGAAAEQLGGRRPMLIVSTAHWAKFGADVWRGLSGLTAGAPLPDDLAARPESDLLPAILDLAPGQTIPAPLADLAGLEVRFPDVLADSPADVQRALLSWLA